MKLLPAASENAAADTLQALRSFEPLLAQLREAGARPRCRFPVHWERTYEAGLPHLAVLQNATKFFALRMAAHLELGQSTEAYEDWHDGFRMLAVTAEEPTIINALVRISCLPILVNGVWSGLVAHQWADSDLRKIETDLAAFHWLKDYVFSMACERGALNSITDSMMADSAQLAKIVKIMRSMDNQSSEVELPSWVYRLYPKGWLYQGKVKLNQYFDDTIARIDPEHQRYFPERVVSSPPEAFQRFPAKLYYLIYAVGVPAFQGMEKRFIWAETFTAQARIACALERHRIARGNFPEALAQLSPDDRPVEIVNGEPYRYRRLDPNAYILYSVGLDQHDDGGVADPKIKSPDRQLDWIWTMPGK